MNDYEYTHYEESGIAVHVSKVGGGTVGRKYDGLWQYRAVDAFGNLIVEGDDLLTGLPFSHRQAAYTVVDYIEAQLDPSTF